MSLIAHPMPRPVLDASSLAPWRTIQTSIISDERNRSGATDGSIRPVSEGLQLVGQAITVEAMVADNLAIHHAIAGAFAGAVLVVDARGHMGNAVWGGIIQRAAELRGLAGVVIDGCIRDVAEIRASRMPCFAAGAVPAGPHKSWGGTINSPVQVGGCPVAPGDIVVGDDDGVAIVPFDLREDLLVACQKRMQLEEEVLRRLETGETTVDIFGLEA